MIFIVLGSIFQISEQRKSVFQVYSHPEVNLAIQSLSKA